jgi:conjugative relaxase-like TrwC/TraI family protein
LSRACRRLGEALVRGCYIDGEWTTARSGAQREVIDPYDQSVVETVAAVESWTAYAMRGHHGDGASAVRIATSGLLGWTMTHQTARPVDGQHPDPHLHAHVSIANMVKGADGKWSTVAAGGKDLHRHALAADSFLKARLRALTARHLGLAWERDAETGAWEVAGVEAAVRELFSKRAGQVHAELDAEGIDPDGALVGQVKTASHKSRQAKEDEYSLEQLREAWRNQALEHEIDPDALVAGALGRAEGPRPVDVAEVAEAVFHPEFGVTAHRKSASDSSSSRSAMPPSAAWGPAAPGRPPGGGQGGGGARGRPPPPAARPPGGGWY